MAVLAVLAVPVVRVLLKRPIRRELRAHPILALALIGGTVLALVFLAWVSMESDAARRLIVAFAAVAGLLALLHARPDHGRKRGLPPGSLGLSTSLDAIDDRAFYARAAERWGPIFKMRQIHRPVACITDLPLSLELLHSQDDALVQSDWAFNRLVPHGYLEFMNGDVHTRYRAILAAAFTTEVVEARQDSLTAVVRQQLATMARHQGSDGIDPEPHLLPIPLTSLLGTVLGVSPDDGRFERLTSLFVKLNRPTELFLPLPRSTQETWRELASSVRELARAARHESPGAEHAPSILARIVEAHPKAPDDDTVMGNLILMVKDGSLMVRGLLRWVLRMLAEEERRATPLRDARANPARLDALAAAFVHETIRLYEGRYVYRQTARDMTIGGYHIPRGWLVRLCMGEAHERADRFPEPKRFDPERFAAGVPDRASFCPFGDGRHACPADDVTFSIAKTFLREAALGYDIRMLRDGDPWRINRHWGLWRPSQQFRIALSPRTGA